MVNEEIYKEANEVVNKEKKKDVNEKGQGRMNFFFMFVQNFVNLPMKSAC
jgi:hypothetical protein